MQQTQHHGLRGRVSPVLTVTGFVDGKCQYLTPYRIDTTKPFTKTVIT